MPRPQTRHVLSPDQPDRHIPTLRPFAGCLRLGHAGRASLCRCLPCRRRRDRLVEPTGLIGRDGRVRHLIWLPTGSRLTFWRRPLPAPLGRPGCRRPPAATLPLCRLRRRGGPELQHLRPIEREIRVALFDRADRLLVQRPTADVDVGRGAKQVKNSGSGLPSSAKCVHDGRCLVSTRIAGKSKKGHLARVGMTSIPPISVSARDEPYAHPPEAWPISGPPISVAAPLPIVFSPGLHGAAAAVRRDAPS